MKSRNINDIWWSVLPLSTNIPLYERLPMTDYPECGKLYPGHLWNWEPSHIKERNTTDLLNLEDN